MCVLPAQRLYHCTPSLWFSLRTNFLLGVSRSFFFLPLVSLPALVTSPLCRSFTEPAVVAVCPAHDDDAYHPLPRILPGLHGGEWQVSQTVASSDAAPVLNSGRTQKENEAEI